jgi:hypothetical protein
MPAFTWNIDPVMVRIPRDIVAIILAGFGLITLLGGYRRKANESVIFGFILLGGAAAVRLMMKAHSRSATTAWSSSWSFWAATCC